MIINLPEMSLFIVVPFTMLLLMHIRIFTKILCLGLRDWQLNFCMRLKLEGYDKGNTLKVVSCLPTPCPVPNSYVELLAPNGMVFAAGAFEVEPLQMGLCFYKTDPHDLSCPLLHVRTRGENSHLQPRRGLSPEPNMLLAS